MREYQEKAAKGEQKSLQIYRESGIEKELGDIQRELLGGTKHKFDLRLNGPLSMFIHLVWGKSFKYEKNGGVTNEKFFGKELPMDAYGITIEINPDSEDITFSTGRTIHITKDQRRSNPQLISDTMAEAFTSPNRYEAFWETSSEGSVGGPGAF